MEEERNTNLPEASSDETSQYEELSKVDAMSGVFTAPGETYETIANTPRKNYWLMPVLIAIALGLVATVLFMQDAELFGKAMEKQTAKMREQFQKSVKEGKMTQEDMDKTMENMGANSPFVRIMGYAGALIGPFLILLVLSTIYFVALKIMKSQVDFVNVMNVVGLAMLIYTVGNVLAVVVSILTGNLTSIGLGLVMSEESVGEKVYGILTKLDVFSIWFYVVIAIGLSKVGRVSLGKTSLIVFTLFLLYVIVTSLVF